MMRAVGRWLIVSMCVMLVACATPQKMAPLSSDKLFERVGRFALSVQHANGKQDAVQGGFAWQDTGQQLKLDLANPLGSTLARVLVMANSAVLTRSNGSQQVASDPDALVELALGSPIPVSGLRDWLQGRAGAGAVDQQLDDQGRVLSFVQSGWRVRLSRYDELGPALLQLNRNDALSDISVRLVVNSH
ncbi:outer membrane lipoprotein LolB [Alcaligenaceae bacterium]|nr:outer membrane lipoprotein LolB [Alcaligenaceae bacterium]